MAGKAAPTIDVVVLGVSHRTAPVALREKLSVVSEQMDATLRELKSLPGVREIALLSTCNRVEVYVVTVGPSCLPLKSWMKRPTSSSTIASAAAAWLCRPFWCSAATPWRSSMSAT